MHSHSRFGLACRNMLSSPCSFIKYELWITTTLQNPIFYSQAYRNSLNENSMNLDMTIQLLEVSSQLIDIFGDYKPIQSLADDRLCQLSSCLQFFSDWEKSVMASNQPPLTKNKMLLSEKLRFDLASMIMGFQQLCKLVLTRCPGGGVVPSRTNSNIVENVFCQQRGRNGQNDNPNYDQYCHKMNGIILGQRITTKKSNTGNVEDLTFFTPSRLVHKKNI